MNQIIRQPIVLNSFSASAATDIVTSGGFVNIATPSDAAVPSMYYPTAASTITRAVAETLAVGKVIITTASSTFYKFIVSQLNTVTGQIADHVIEYTSDATATGAEIISAINAAILASSSAKGGALYVTSSGSGTSTVTMTITALTGHAVFSMTGVSNCACYVDGTNSSTVGVYPVGTAARVNAVTNLNGVAVSGHIYTTISFNGFANTSSLMTGRGTSAFNQTLYLDENATNFSTFLTGITNVLNGLKVGGSVADPELISAM